jgi:glycosyltransferase involved in cell wall biosynthesis
MTRGTPKSISRIIVIDPGLRDNVGHPIEYDQALEAAAHAEGLTTLILAHKDVLEAFPQKAAFTPTFSADMWGEVHVPAALAVRWRVRLQRVLACSLRPLDRIPWAKISAYCTPRSRWEQAGRQATSCAVHDRTPAARSSAGYFLDRALSGLGRVLLQAARRLSAPGLCVLGFMRHPAFYFECSRALRTYRFGEGDLAFCHMVAQRNILECAWLATKLPRSAAPRLVLLFRYPASFYRPDRLATKLGIRLLERAWREGRVRLSTDSVKLAQEYAQLTEILFEVFPIPHTRRFIPSQAAARCPSLRIGSLGNPREDKGFNELVDALLLFRRVCPELRVEFVVQVNNPGRNCARSVERLRAAGLPNVTFVEHALPSADYAGLLASLDIILLAYPQDAYRARTSGVFIEAVAAGKPVVVTAGTWMADELGRWGAGVVIERPSPAGIARAVGTAVSEFAALHAKAQETAAACASFHSPRALLRCLVEGGRGAASALTRSAEPAAETPRAVPHVAALLLSAAQRLDETEQIASREQIAGQVRSPRRHDVALPVAD